MSEFCEGHGNKKMSLFLDIIAGLIVIAGAILWLALLVRSWKVLGLAISVLEHFLEHHQKLWDALDAIRSRRDQE